VQNARGNRQFIEERYNKNLSDLAASEIPEAFQKNMVYQPCLNNRGLHQGCREITGQL